MRFNLSNENFLKRFISRIMSEDEDEVRTLGKRNIEEDSRFNTLFSRLELENRFDLFLIDLLGI